MFSTKKSFLNASPIWSPAIWPFPPRIHQAHKTPLLASVTVINLATSVTSITQRTPPKLLTPGNEWLRLWNLQLGFRDLLKIQQMCFCSTNWEPEETNVSCQILLAFWLPNDPHINHCSCQNTKTTKRRHMVWATILWLATSSELPWVTSLRSERTLTIFTLLLIRAWHSNL